VNIHGAIDLESGKTQMLDVHTVDAQCTILLRMAILAAHPALRMIHVFLDNAPYYHARLVREWLVREGLRITLHFVPASRLQLNPIERLWGAMHRNVTHNRCYPSFRDFKAVAMEFLIKAVPENWTDLCDQVSDNFVSSIPRSFGSSVGQGNTVPSFIIFPLIRAAPMRSVVHLANGHAVEFLGIFIEELALEHLVEMANLSFYGRLNAGK
jgi:hypothetical protein